MVEGCFGGVDDTTGCDHADHDEVYFHCRCNAGGQIEPSYKRDCGSVIVGCMECGQTLARIAVADQAGTMNDA